MRAKTDRTQYGNVTRLYPAEPAKPKSGDTDYRELLETLGSMPRRTADHGGDWRDK